MFDGDIGPVSAKELMEMTNSQWGLLRDMITDKHNGGEGVTAKCLMCGHPVFIQSRLNEDTHLPYFAHYRGGDINCPWYHGKANTPDNVRASQYKGHQESPVHRAMCEKLAEVVQLDSRYITHRIDQYLPPTENDTGRYPDVYVEWEEIGPFAIEFQLSNTFETEVSQRCIHYYRERIPLLWILYGINDKNQIPQSFRDVIRRHRENAFVFDSAASRASFEQSTLVLSCFLVSNSGKLEGPRLVRFDELNIPSNKIPYFEDRLIWPRLTKTREIRASWFEALSQWDMENYNDDKIQRVLSSLPMKIPNEAVTLIAAAFSIVANANNRNRNYASRHNNLKAMLNSYLQSNNGRLAPYVNLLTRLISNTSIGNLLSGSVKQHFDRITRDQVTEESPEWKALAHLIPEALDPLWRKDLTYCNELPTWAVSKG